MILSENFNWFAFHTLACNGIQFYIYCCLNLHTIKHGQHGHGQHARSNPNCNPNRDYYSDIELLLYKMGDVIFFSFSALTAFCRIFTFPCPRCPCPRCPCPCCPCFPDNRMMSIITV